MRAVAALALLAAGCQLVAAFGTDELRCPCPESHECVDDHCVPYTGSENSLLRCRDGFDNDGDAATDCNDAGCVEADACDPYEAPCDPLTHEGCPAGLVCILTRNSTGNIATFCRQTGFRAVGQSCEREGEQTETCSAGTACVLYSLAGPSLCVELCRSDADCPDWSLCGFGFSDPVDFGFCTLPCLPWEAGARCPADFACYPVLIDPPPATSEGGATTACLYAEGYAFDGVLEEGADCIPNSRDPDELCRLDLACTPIGGFYTCVRYCDADASPPAGCGPCLSMQLGPDPDDVIHTADGRTLGVCYGDAS